MAACSAAGEPAAAASRRGAAATGIADQSPPCCVGCRSAGRRSVKSGWCPRCTSARPSCLTRPTPLSRSPGVRRCWPARAVVVCCLPTLRVRATSPGNRPALLMLCSPVGLPPIPLFPAGFGTLDETLEITTWQQLGFHSKPVRRSLQLLHAPAAGQHALAWGRVRRAALSRARRACAAATLGPGFNAGGHPEREWLLRQAARVSGPRHRGGGALQWGCAACRCCGCNLRLRRTGHIACCAGSAMPTHLQLP